MYWYWSMFPSSTWSSDFPRLWKAPHIVTPPVCTQAVHTLSKASSACLSIRTRPSWRYSKNLDSSLNTTSCQWSSHQFKCPRAHTNRVCRCLFLAVGASSHAVLPNNQRSKVDNSPAELPQEHCWKGSIRHVADMKVLFGYYRTVRADIGHVYLWFSWDYPILA